MELILLIIYSVIVWLIFFKFKLLPWYIMGPGIALLALSSAALLVDRREGARPRVSSEAAAG